MTIKPTAKVRKAFELLRKYSDTITITDAAKKAKCCRSAIYRSKLYDAWKLEQNTTEKS